MLQFILKHQIKLEHIINKFLINKYKMNNLINFKNK